MFVCFCFLILHAFYIYFNVVWYENIHWESRIKNRHRNIYNFLHCYICPQHEPKTETPPTRRVLLDVVKYVNSPTKKLIKYPKMYRYNVVLVYFKAMKKIIYISNDTTALYINNSLAIWGSKALEFTRSKISLQRQVNFWT
jgi:hypothetical protein